MASEAAETLRMADYLGLGENSSESTDASLRKLIERAQAGDLAAFEQIIVHHQRRVVRTAWRILGNQEDARDAAQEAFLRVFKYLGKFKADEEFAGWLYRIVINVCRDIARKRKFISFEREHELGTF